MALSDQGGAGLEFKMQRDHLDREEMEWALLRRQAQQRLRAHERPSNGMAAALGGGRLPAGLAARRAAHLRGAPGCYRLEPAFYEVYWIAANELPLGRTFTLLSDPYGASPGRAR